jgi:hypothetical protein
MNCLSCLLKSEGAISTYEVVDHVKVNDGFRKEIRYCVFYNDEECEVKCTC